MSGQSVGEVLEMLADWRDAQHAYLTQDDDNEDSLFVRLTVTERRLDKLDRAHIRTLANALTPPAPASAQVEIISPQGRVAYRRPLGHPDVLEALQRPGYSVRKAEEGGG